MNPTIVYILCGQPGSYFSVCTRVSMTTLRLTNPDVKVALLVDSRTFRQLKDGRDPVLDLPDQVIPVETPYSNDMINSRYLKITMRSEIPDGDLLYIDNDTVIRGSISGIPGGDCDIAGVRNHGQSEWDRQISESDLDILKQLGVPIHRKNYLNGGLLYLRDSPAARLFCESWKRHWEYCGTTLSVHRDQPALNAALNETKAVILDLDDRFNAQFLTHNPSALTGVILHYYSSNQSMTITNFDHYVKRVLGGEPFRIGEVDKLIHARHPWRVRMPVLDDWYCRYLLRKPFLNRHDWDWLQGKRLQSVFGRIPFLALSIYRHVVKGERTQHA